MLAFLPVLLCPCSVWCTLTNLLPSPTVFGVPNNMASCSQTLQPGISTSSSGQCLPAWKKKNGCSYLVREMEWFVGKVFFLTKSMRTSSTHTGQHRSSNQGAALEGTEPALHHRRSSAPKGKGARGCTYELILCLSLYLVGEEERWKERD